MLDEVLQLVTKLWIPLFELRPICPSVAHEGQQCEYRQLSHVFCVMTGLR